MQLTRGLSASSGTAIKTILSDAKCCQYLITPQFFCEFGYVWLLNQLNSINPGSSIKIPFDFVRLAMLAVWDNGHKGTTSMRWEGEAIYSQTHALSHGYPVALGWPCFLLQRSNGLLLIFVAASPAPLVIQWVKTSTGCWLCGFSPKGVGREDLLFSSC